MAARSESVSDLLEVRVSVPDEATGTQLAGKLVEGGLAACVQRVGPITSTYVWQGEVEHETEWLLLVKTTAAAFDALTAAVTAAHPYEVPEILAVPVSNSLAQYRQWVLDAVRPG